MGSQSVPTTLGMKEPSCLETVKETKRKAIPLTITCPTCGRPAPDHLHYGGQSCYPCRAFFRRISTISRSDVECISGTNDCFASFVGKRCIKCRYKKCLEAGMKAELVKDKGKSHNSHKT